MQAIVLAGGKGERLWPITATIPKAMVQLLRKPLLRYHIDWLASEGVSSVVLACGYRANSISDYLAQNAIESLDIRLSIEEKPLGRGGAARRAATLLPSPNKPCIVSHGDIITDIPLGEVFDAHCKAGTTLTMILVPYRSRFGVATLGDNGFVRDFRERPRLPYWINSGILVVSPEFFRNLPAEGDEESTIRMLIERHRVSSFCTTHYWRPVDSRKDISEAEKELALPNLPHENPHDLAQSA